MQAKFTIGTDILFKPYHIPLIRDKLTKDLDYFSVPLMEELALAIGQHMGMESGTSVHVPWLAEFELLILLLTGEWKVMKGYEFSANTLAQGMSRVFVGEELCKSYIPYLLTKSMFPPYTN